MKRFLTIASLLFCLFGFAVILFLESYTYPGFWQTNLFMPFSVLFYTALGLSGLIVLYAAKKYRSETAKVLFSLTLLGGYVLLWITANFNQELVAVSDGNLEILYGRYHLDIRVINQARKLIPPFFTIIAILFFQDIVLFANKILGPFGAFLWWGGRIFIDVWRYLKVPQHRNRVRGLFQHWDIACFVVSLLLFWDHQLIFSDKLPNMQLIIRMISAYVVLGIVVAHKNRVTVAIIASILVWVLIGLLHFLEIFKLPWAVLLSLLAGITITGLYLLELGKKVKHG